MKHGSRTGTNSRNGPFIIEFLRQPTQDVAPDPQARLFRSALDSLTGFRKEICGLPPQLALPLLRLLETILKGNPQLHICIFVALIRNHSRQDMERLHPFATLPSRKYLD